jgi:titin
VRRHRFTFECRLECDTKSPVIEWFKDGQPITNPDYKQIYRDGLCQLVVEKTFPDDSAKYTCKATTDAGVTDTSAALKVRGTNCPYIVCNMFAALNLFHRQQLS